MLARRILYKCHLLLQNRQMFIRMYRFQYVTTLHCHCEIMDNSVRTFLIGYKCGYFFKIPKISIWRDGRVVLIEHINPLWSTIMFSIWQWIPQSRGNMGRRLTAHQMNHRNHHQYTVSWYDCQFSLHLIILNLIYYIFFLVYMEWHLSKTNGFLYYITVFCFS